MSCHYRCSRCRARNVLPRAVHEYIRKPTCKSCGYARFYPDWERVRRKSCTCEGAYHWGAHRAGSPYCLQNPNAYINRAKRGGASDEDLADLRIDLALSGIGGRSNFPPGVVPF